VPDSSENIMEATKDRGQPISTLCMACEDASCNFQPMELQRRPLSDMDVLIEMKYCGVCHTDLHFAANHMKSVLKTTYPCVPGHELVGICSAVGSNVTKVKVGDHIGVGCMVDSCRECKACKRGEEQMCIKQVATYQGKDFGSGRAATFPTGGKTLGGYTTRMVVDEHFAIKIPPDYPLEAAGPVMCAGVTMFDPLMRQGAKAGTRVGIVGLGGLGVLGIKLAAALGCKVTAISRSAAKESLARDAGATRFVVSSDRRQMVEARNSLDLILNTIPTAHDYQPFSELLARGGKQVLLGISPQFAAALVVGLLSGGSSKVVASGIGSVQRTQDVIDFCAKHGIQPSLEVFPVEQLNSIYEKLDRCNDTGLRYVMDIEGSLKESSKEACAAAPPPELSPPTGTISICGVVSEIFKLLCCCRCC